MQSVAVSVDTAALPAAVDGWQTIAGFTPTSHRSGTVRRCRAGGRASALARVASAPVQPSPRWLSKDVPHMGHTTQSANKPVYYRICSK